MLSMRERGSFATSPRVWAQTLHTTLSTLHPMVTLEYLKLRILPHTIEKRPEALGIMNRFLTNAREHAREVDGLLAGLVQAGRVGYVDVIMFTVPAVLGLRPLFLYRPVKLLRELFPQLDELGALRV